MPGAASLKRAKAQKQARRNKPHSAPGIQQRLRELMAAHALTRGAVAQRLGVSLHTVHAWLRPQSNRAHRAMPAALLRLLELTLRHSAQ